MRGIHNGNLDFAKNLGGNCAEVRTYFAHRVETLEHLMNHSLIQINRLLIAVKQLISEQMKLISAVVNERHRDRVKFGRADKSIHCGSSSKSTRRIVLRSTSKMTAVDQPNSITPFIAVSGPSRRQSCTGVMSP